jgi:HAE1 family hydrophobic/amphiphilic exporter-1
VLAPIISSTLTTVAIFIPVLFLNREFRDLYSGLALTVTFALSASVVSAIVVIPGGYGLFARLGHGPGEYHTRLSRRIEIGTMDFIGFFWRRSVIMTLVSAAVLIAMPAVLMKIGKEFTDPQTGHEVTCYVEMEAGTSLAETDRIVSEVESIYKNDPGIVKVNTRVEKWHGEIDLTFDPSRYRSREKFIEAMKEKTDRLRECMVVYEEKGDSGGKLLDIDIIGDDETSIRKLASDAARSISGIPGIRNVVLKFKEGKPSLTWVIDRNKCLSHDITMASAGEQIRWAVYGPVALKYIHNRHEMDLRISFPESARATLDQIREMFVYNSTGGKVMIKELGRFQESREPGKIFRKNKRKTVRIGVYYDQLSTGKAIEMIKENLAKLPLKEGYYFDYGDALERLQESQKSALFALLLSILIIYAILAVQFESFIIPLKIIPVIPLSAGFSIIVLYLLQMTLNVSVYIGLIVLAGVVVNNTILITEGILESSRRNLFNTYQVIKSRIKPVLITTLTTIIGLVPMVFQFGEGSELWRPLSITLITGLIFGTLINLTLFPLLFIKMRR